MPVPEAIFNNRHIALKQCRHGYFLFSRNDTFIGRSLDLYGEWCEGEIDAIFKLTQPGFIAVDIGANIGTHTVPLAQKVTDSGLVIAFEPQSGAFRYLCANVAINNLVNVVCMNQAVGATSGIVNVPILNPEMELNFGGVGLENSEGIPTEIIPLDSLSFQKCNLLKIDVEGMEPQVLDGARNTIRKLRPLIFLETTLVNSVSVIERLQDFNYQCFWHIANYYNPANFFGNPNNIFQDIHPETNLLCIPKEASIMVSGLEEVTGINDNWPAALERMRARG